MARVITLRLFTLFLPVPVRVLSLRGLDDVLHAVEVETADAEHEIEIHHGVFGALNRREVVDGAHARLHGAKFRFSHKISFVHHDTVSERDLLQGFVDHPFRLHFVEVHHRVLGIYQRHHAVQAKGVQKVRLEVKGLDDGRGVC